MSRIKNKKPKSSAKAKPKPKAKPAFRFPKKSKGVVIPVPRPGASRGVVIPVPKPKTPIKLSTAYKCINNTGDLTFYFLELKKGARGFKLDLPPKTVSWKKSFSIQELKTQGNLSQPLYFSLAENRRLTLSGIVFDQEKGVLPHEKLIALQNMQEPNGTKLKVYQLAVGNFQAKSFAARSYGRFVIASIDITEQMRDSLTGKTVRAVVTIELIEVSKKQIDFGRDLAVPTVIVPTLPEGLDGSAPSKTELGSTSPNPGEETPEQNNVILAGTPVARAGFRGLGEDSTKTKVVVLFNNKPLTNVQKSAISLGPWNKAARTKLSELKNAVLSSPMFKCPIVIEKDMFFRSFSFNPTTKVSKLELECFVTGFEGVYSFLHIESLEPGIDTTKKRVSSAQPTNTGGNAKPKKS